MKLLSDDTPAAVAMVVGLVITLGFYVFGLWVLWLLVTT
jgi:hypothetical protein